MSDIVLLGNVEKTIIQSMARTLFVAGYADFCEENNYVKRPGPGGDWFDVAPKTPDEFTNIAYRLTGAYEQINDASLICIFASACRENNVSYITPPKNFVEQYGYYIAMSSLGHGVNWTDDHEDHYMSGKEVTYPMFDISEHYDYSSILEKEDGFTP